MGIELCNAKNIQMEKERQEAKHLYAMFAPQFSKNTERLCESCKKRPVAPYHRLCSLCAIEREKARARKAMQKRRSGVTKVDQKGT
jgi:hypothetical protein